MARWRLAPGPAAQLPRMRHNIKPTRHDLHAFHGVGGRGRSSPPRRRDGFDPRACQGSASPPKGREIPDQNLSNTNGPARERPPFPFEGSSSYPKRCANHSCATAFSMLRCEYRVLIYSSGKSVMRGKCRNSNWSRTSSASFTARERAGTTKRPTDTKPPTSRRRPRNSEASTVAATPGCATLHRCGAHTTAWHTAQCQPTVGQAKYK